MPADQAACLVPHLDLCEGCRLSVGLGAQELAGWDRSTQIRTLSDGELVGRYRIRALVGRGGMGEVYEAFDEELQERVALKTVRVSALDQSNVFDRFKAEVLLARRVTHANVCRVLEFGRFHRRDGSGAAELIPYFTMEFLQGHTLGQRLQERGPLPGREVVALAGQMAAGLEAIHQAGIVHRDFKSENVLIVADRDAGAPRALVTDFGLARLHDGLPSAAMCTPAGTIDYMAPEQILGRSLGPATDVFALGVVIFEMLTGTRPRQAALLPMAPGRQGETPALRALVSGLPRAWDPFLARCLARDPGGRFQSMNELREALGTIDHGWWRRWQRGLRPSPHRGLSLMGAAALAAVLTFAGVFASGRDDEGRRHRGELAMTTSVLTGPPPNADRPREAAPAQEIPAPSALPDRATPSGPLESSRGVRPRRSRSGAPGPILAPTPAPTAPAESPANDAPVTLDHLATPEFRPTRDTLNGIADPFSNR